MARHAIELGHDYLALTDHSPSLSIAQGLVAERLREQLDVVAALNAELAPFRILTGIEVDILDDGDARPGAPTCSRELDVVVASVHSKLRMDAAHMTDRMIAALASPHVDILGHCTGRLIVGRGRPESKFDAELVFAARGAPRQGRRDQLPPRAPRSTEAAARARRSSPACKVSIDCDAHATWQLDWQPYGCHRAAEAELPIERIVNTWPVDDLLAWTASHATLPDRRLPTPDRPAAASTPDDDAVPGVEAERAVDRLAVTRPIGADPDRPADAVERRRLVGEVDRDHDAVAAAPGPDAVGASPTRRSS